MKHANWIVVATLVVLSGLAAAQRIGSSVVVAEVPFEFMVGNKIVPAGQCAVQAATMSGNTLMIRNTDATVSLFSLWLPTEGKRDASDYALVFTHYGDRYFLTGIKLQGSKIAYRLPESGAEAELRAQNVSATEKTVLASLK